MQKKPAGKVLVVDDDATSRKVLARTLSSTGYDCREAKSGREGLDLIRTEQPSLLLLDFDMPGLDGAQVLERLRSDKDPAIAQLPVIMLTGHGGEESEVLCLEAGADDFVTQQMLIPQRAPRLPGWELAACYRPVIQVGGDIYGWLRMIDGRILFWIADATGHGAAAALLTTLAKLLFHHRRVEHQAPV